MIEIKNNKKIKCKADIIGKCSFDCKECIYDDIENFRKLYNKTGKRYQLKSGKFGYYFYDKQVDIDLNLEMVLNRLNLSEIKILSGYHKASKLRRELYKRD